MRLGRCYKEFGLSVRERNPETGTTRETHLPRGGESIGLSSEEEEVQKRESLRAGVDEINFNFKGIRGG